MLRASRTGNGELVLCTLNVMRPDVMDNFYETLPSERYLAVMIEGATQHNLPASWIDALHPLIEKACWKGRFRDSVGYVQFDTVVFYGSLVHPILPHAIQDKEALQFAGWNGLLAERYTSRSRPNTLFITLSYVTGNMVFFFAAIRCDKEMLRRTGCVPRSLYRSFPVSSELSLFTPAQRPGSAHADHAVRMQQCSAL